jgi:hypothetical protein
VGEAWPDAIHNALDACDCVLVFWSDYANAERKYVVEEAEKGLLDGKLVQVELDPHAMRKCDKIFTRIQAVSYHTWPRDRAIEIIAEKTTQKMLQAASRRREAERIRHPALIPYVINRHPQINDLRSDLCMTFKQELGANSGPKAVYISRGVSKDCPEHLFQRFEEIDGPKICDQFDKRYARQPDGGIVTGWPTDDDARPFEVAREVAKIVNSNFPSGYCLARTSVEKLRRNEADYIEQWFKAWDLQFTKNPDLLFIPVLDLRLDSLESSWSLFSGKRCVLDRIFDVVAEWAAKADRGHSSIMPVKFARLGPVSRDDAYGWAWRHFGQDMNRIKADELVRKLFRTAKARLPMTEFAEGVTSAAWFQELLEAMYRHEA